MYINHLDTPCSLYGYPLKLKPGSKLWQQFCIGGSKRTSRLMMNGVLMANGIDAISVPAASAQEFSEKMGRFYLTKDATEMMAFLVACHPDAARIQASLRSAVEDDAGESQGEHSAPK